jgi:hypothetical protein
VKNKSLLLGFFVRLFLLAFGLNWLWEMAQMSAYAEMASSSWWETAPACTWATLGDVVFTFAIYGLGALAAGRLDWGLDPRWYVYVTAAILGAACGGAFECWAVRSGRWSYDSRMPIVPGLHIGLWPLLQLTILVPAALGLAAWWTGRKRV